MKQQQFYITFTFSLLYPWASPMHKSSHLASYGLRVHFWQPGVPSTLKHYSLLTFAQERVLTLNTEAEVFSGSRSAILVTFCQQMSLSAMS